MDLFNLKHLMYPVSQGRIMYKLLYIEADHDLHDLISSTFDGLCNVEFATSIEKANEILRGKEVHFIISDVKLPDGSSLDYFQELNQEYELPPIIFLSGNDNIKSKIQGLLAGGSDFVTKPADPKTLRTRIEILISDNY